MNDDGRRNKGRTKTRTKSARAKRLDRLDELALSHGMKPFKSVKDVARGTPADADELLEAIRELRELRERERGA